MHSTYSIHNHYIRPVHTWRQQCVFFRRHVRTVTLMTMQPISDDMVTTSKICVIVAKCEWALTFII